MSARARPKKPVALVSMPTLGARSPSFQLALLKPTLERAGIELQPFSLFVYFGRHIGWQLNEVLANVYPCMAGEWLWSKAAFGDFADDEAYLAYYERNFREICREAGCTLGDLRRVRERATFEFINEMVESVDWSRFSLIGFSVVFQQMVATLAMAKALKRKHPHIPIVLGGATFEDDIALQVIQASPDVDFVHCGDGDASFPELVKRLHAGRSMTGLPGLMWRDGDRIVYAGRAPNLEDLNQTPTPDFDEYFYARSHTGYGASPAAEPLILPIETARGCWYGAKNHCTFCGLNRAGLDFRAKSPDRVLEMLKALSRRYDFHHFNAIDNILAPEYVTELFGKLAEAHTDLKLHYEIRPNLTRAQLKMMRRGGLFSVQPGVESLSTHVLGLMKKHTTGVKNLELLKWTTYYGIDNLYNILTGFPGETREDYRLQADVIRQIPHLQPPYAIVQARPDRGSPMYEAPHKHSISRLEPSECYRYIFPPERFDLRKVAYYFEHTVLNILPDEDYDECYVRVADWQARWKEEPKPFLRYRKSWDALTLEDGRGAQVVKHALADRAAKLYELCAEARRKEDLVAKLGDEAWVSQTLASLVEAELVILLDGKYLALALPENPDH